MRARRLLLLTCAAAGGAGALCAFVGWPWNPWPRPPPPAAALELDTDTLPADVAPVSAPATPAAPRALSADEEAARAIAAETELGRWDREAIARVRTLLRDRSISEAEAVMRLAGFERRTARLLARTFTCSQALYDRRLGDRTLLLLSFVRVGVEDWEPTPETAANLRLPFHPKLPSRLEPPPSLGQAKGTYEKCDGIGRHVFPSKVVAEALRCTLGFRGHHFQLTTSTDLLRDDWSFADRIDHALSNVPADHLGMVRQIVIDPGDHPKRSVAATTSWDGTEVHMFLAGAGRDVLQMDLDETTVHEFGHVVSLQQDDWFWTRWYEAIWADKFGVSAYGLTNGHEDFAETYELYLAGGRMNEALRAKYPRRFAVMDTLFR